jgi:hypothetical protein
MRTTNKNICDWEKAFEICLQNKTENAFSPLPARTKASNADMTACLPLQDCIVQITRLPAYGRKLLPPRCSPADKATGLRPDNFAPLQWQFLKLHTSALQSLAVAGYQTANMQQQQQQSKMYSRGALQALAGKNLFSQKLGF